LNILASLSYARRSVASVLTGVDLATGPDLTIRAVTCRDEHKGWSEAEVGDDYRVVLVRRGRFLRRAAGVPSNVDPTVAYVGLPGEEEYFAHPSGGDVCTSISLKPALWRVLAGDATAVARPTVYVDARLDLAHRRILAAAATGDIDYALMQELLGLLSAALGQVAAGRTEVTVRATGIERTLVAAARDAIADGHPASTGLLALAELLRLSPYRLSRAFSREMGVSITRYRNRVRVARALDRLEGGERSLGVLAADLGFADQAHLCRTVREHLGRTPTALRRILAPTRV
jgi:AraC-like DNA-binding protein